jgi:hypothetical protein
MPIYYFNIRAGEDLIRDEEGTDLPDIETAISEARQSARDLAIEELRNGQKVDGRCIEIVDSEGKKVAVVAVRDVVD